MAAPQSTALEAPCLPLQGEGRLRGLLLLEGEPAQHPAQHPAGVPVPALPLELGRSPRMTGARELGIPQPKREGTTEPKKWLLGRR